MYLKGSRRLVQISFLLTLFAFFAAPFDPGPAFAAPAPTTAYSQVPVPSQLVLTVRETAGVPRVNEVVRSGVPMPRSLNLRSVAGLAVVDASGTPVPAELKVTARWNAGKNDTTAPIQWLLVSFPATVGAYSSASYRVVTDGSVANPAPSRPVTVTRNGNAVTVDTGAAIFRLGASSGTLFDEVVLDNGTRLIGGGNLSLRTNGADWNHSTTRKVWIEHQGPLTAVIQVQGAYDVPPVGDGQMSTRRRYVFTAGSPTAVVRHVVNWEGTLACVGCVTTGTGSPNGVRIDRLRDELRVELGGTPSVTAVGNFGAAPVTGTVGSTGSAWVRQQLRPGRKSPRVFDVNVGGATATGVKADGGVLAASGPAGTVAIALGHMHRYEPQALRLLPGGSLAVDLADDKVWLTSKQGLFATLAVTAVAGSPSRQDLDRVTWAPLNRPLHAWAQPEWFASSDAVDEFPVGPLPADLASYDTLISSVLNATVEKTDTIGLNGLMTFGLYPRYWAEPGYEGEVDCGTDGGGDPTPGEAWDNTFWCGAWTDYHNTTSTAPIWAMRTGDVEWLDELAFPAALRVLHTQIIQCSPTDRWFYCGQAPAGYGAYRTDFNSSHAYLENLYLYYWLTGDATVIDILQRGADSMRRYVCNTRGSLPVLEPTGPGGPACADDHPVNPEAAALTGRVGQQWLATYRFMGLASNDASFLEDVRSSIGRSVTQFYADLVRGGVHYGFWGGPAVVGSAGTYTTDSQWTVPMYDMNNLWRFLRDTGDAPVGIPAVRPSQVMANVARTFKDLEPAVIGDGSPSGFWARLLQYSWSGSRLGGTLTDVIGADRELYNSEKGGAPALLVRAGQHMGEPALLDYGRQTTLYMLNWSSRTIPMSKLQGQNLTRLHAAVGRLVNGNGSTPPPPPPPPPPAAPVAPSALTARSASQTEIVLDWRDNSNNETSFHVEQSSGGGAFQQIQTLGANVITTRVTGLDPATTYTYRVRASNGDGHSPYSNTASATTQPPPPPGPTVPADPTALTASAVSETEVVLNWQDNSSDESLFRIERQVNGVFQEIQTVGANVTTARVGNLASGATHSFRVRASNDAGFSGYSNIASANTPAPPPPPPPATAPAAPSKLQVVTVEATDITLSWHDNSNDETQFHVEQRVGNAYQQILVVGANVTAVNVTGLTPNTTYTFRVRASNAAGFSDYSNVARGKTSRGTTAGTSSLTAPTNFKIRHLGGGTTEFTWNDNSTDEVRFQVEELVNRDYVPRTTVGRNATHARLNLRLGVSYTFRIRVTNAAGQTAVSRPANINVFR